MQQRWFEFQKAGVEGFGIVQAKPETLQWWLKREPRPLRFLSDSERKFYRAMDLERATWGRILSWKALKVYLRLIARGWGVRIPVPEEDKLQLGGDFLFDAQHRLRYAYRSEDPGDRPSCNELLRQVQMLGGS